MDKIVNLCTGIFCLGFMIVGSIEILGILAYYALLHKVKMNVIGFITGFLSSIVVGYCLFKLITEIAIIFRRNENEPDFVPTTDETRRQRFFKFASITLSLIAFVALSLNSFYLTKTANDVCKKRGECAPQIVFFGCGFAVLLVYAIRKVQEKYPQLNELEHEPGYNQFNNESEA